MTRHPQRELVAAGIVWAVCTTAFGVLFTEYSLQGLGPEVRGIARIVANITAGFTLLGVAGMAMGFAALIWLVLRWIEVEVRFGVVVGALWPGFAVLAAHAAAGAVAVWLAPAHQAPPDVAADWSAYQAGLMAAPPLAFVARARTVALVAAGGAVWAAVKRRAGCSWLDAGIGVGAALSVMGLATLLAGAVT